FNQEVDTILRTPSISRVVISSNFNTELSHAYYEASLTCLLNELEGKEVVFFCPTPSAPIAVGESLWKARLFGEQEESV
ncbi:acyltransferase, partial [Vibrio parahaemolyticus]|nr:acyltransferase [Vibrio parahaemolyticus]